MRCPESLTICTEAFGFHRGMDTAGEALAEPDEHGELEVQLGSLRTRVRSSIGISRPASASSRGSESAWCASSRGCRARPTCGSTG